MPTDELTRRNKVVIHALMEASDRGDLAAVEAMYHPEYIDHHPSALRSGATAREALCQVFAQIRAAFPDTRHTLHDLVAEGDKVAARLTARGTHTGPLWGHAPTGRTVEQTNIAIYRLVDGQIIERWSYEVTGILDQIGALPGGPVK
jgi:predicted ester cyclase